ncbi:unnamed protein product, partial [Discosporangium mesarthrocarpum]
VAVPVAAGVPSGEELDVFLSECYAHWVKKRAQGGPLLRCFHEYPLMKWGRMEVEELEYEDEDNRVSDCALQDYQHMQRFRL